MDKPQHAPNEVEIRLKEGAERLFASFGMDFATGVAVLRKFVAKDDLRHHMQNIIAYNSDRKSGGTPK